jgi:acyl transferase domain-containing protein
LSACRKAGEPPLIVGSVKTNIGHQENGSGVAGIIKTVMALQKRKIPPNVNLKTPNKRIDMDALGVRVPLTLEDWPTGKRLRASINSYGYGGTNAHAILDAASEHVGPQELSMRSGQDPRLFILSSKNSKVTKKMADNLKYYLISKQQKGDPADLDDLSFTLSERRSVFPWRTSISALGTESLIKALDDPTKISIANARNLPKIGFVFTGQGAQWYAMARELIKGPYLIFQESLSQATLIFKEYGATWSLLGMEQ